MDRIPKPSKKPKGSREKPIIPIPPKIILDERLDPAFAPKLTEAINELVFRTRNALISHYNIERDNRQQAEEIYKLEELVKVLRKQQQQRQKGKPSLKVKDNK